MPYTEMFDYLEDIPKVNRYSIQEVQNRDIYNITEFHKKLGLKGDTVYILKNLLKVLIHISRFYKGYVYFSNEKELNIFRMNNHDFNDYLSNPEMTTCIVGIPQQKDSKRDTLFQGELYV